MSRTVDHWYGKPDDPVPPRVRVRVFERFGGVCQCGCGIKIAGKPWQCDHVVALINGGLNVEGNLAPLLVEHHKAKTANDVATKSKTARIKAKHLGVARQRSTAMPGSRASKWKRKLDGTVVRRDE